MSDYNIDLKVDTSCFYEKGNFTAWPIKTSSERWDDPLIYAAKSAIGQLGEHYTRISFTTPNMSEYSMNINLSLDLKTYDNCNLNAIYAWLMYKDLDIPSTKSLRTSSESEIKQNRDYYGYITNVSSSLITDSSDKNIWTSFDFNGVKLKGNTKYYIYLAHKNGNTESGWCSFFDPDRFVLENISKSPEQLHLSYDDPKGLIYIGDGNKLNPALSFIWSDNSWHQIMTHVYSDGSFRLCN